MFYVVLELKRLKTTEQTQLISGVEICLDKLFRYMFNYFSFDLNK